MKFLKYIFITLIVLLFPFRVDALDEYVDKVYDIVGVEASEKVTIYFFHSDECPHCKRENTFLDSLKNEFGSKILIYKYEVSSSKNDKYMTEVKKRMGSISSGVPFTVIGDKYYLGYSESTGEIMKDTIEKFLTPVVEPGPDPSPNPDPIPPKEEGEYIDLPIIGKVNTKDVSVPLIATVLGILDGFNPCALWVLLFLLNILFTLNDRKKMWLIGGTFLFVSGLIYFLAMLGIGIFLNMAAVIWVRRIIAIVAIVGGIININTYIKTRKDDGCHVVDEAKRKKYFSKIKKLSKEENLIFAVLGVALLAASVNLVEFACTAGFPAIYMSILKLNDIVGIKFIMYVLLYVLMYMMIPLIIFFIAMMTAKLTGVTTKYTKWVHLIGGILMLLIGLLLIFKPEWIMLNF